MMVEFFKKKFNTDKKLVKNRTVRSLPRMEVRSKVIGEKRKTKSAFFQSRSLYLKIVAWIMGGAFVGLTIYAFMFSQLMVVNMIDIGGAKKLSESELRRSVFSMMQGKMGDIFRKDNLIFADRLAIESQLLERYKMIRKIQISKKFPNKIIIELEERDPMLVYCIGGDCFVIDEEGKPFAKADFVKNELGEKNLIRLDDESGKKIDVNSFFIELDFIHFAQEVKKESELRGFAVSNNFSTPILISGDVRVETEAGWKIYFNRQFGAKAGMEMLETVLKNSIEEDKIRDLEYVDVRLQDKVYYKFKANVQENSSENIDNPDTAPKTDEPKKSEKKKK